MTWSLRDGSHEGGVGTVLLDGTTDWGALGRPLTLESIEEDAAGRRGPSGWQDVYVVGWIAGCVCGWRGTVFARTMSRGRPTLAAEALSERGDVPVDLEDGPMHDAWRAHVAGRWMLDELARLTAEHAAAASRLDAGVRAARASGSSWADIARVVGISRQSAHQRWSRAEH